MSVKITYFVHGTTMDNIEHKSTRMASRRIITKRNTAEHSFKRLNKYK